MLGIAIHCIQYSQAMLERGVCELAHSFFHYLFKCLISISTGLFCVYIVLILCVNSLFYHDVFLAHNGIDIVCWYFQFIDKYTFQLQEFLVHS